MSTAVIFIIYKYLNKSTSEEKRNKRGTGE